MRAMLTLSHVAKAYGAHELFKDVTFMLTPGRRVALVGGNGVGKTTLLEMVVGVGDEPDAGSITKQAHVEIGYLPQDVTDNAEGSVLEHVLDGAGEVRRIYLDASRAKRVLAWEPRTSFAQGLERTVAWSREAGA